MSFAGAGLVAGLAGTAVNAYGQLQQGDAAAQAGQAANEAAAYQAEVAKNNAEIAESNSELTIAAGQAKAATESMKGAAQLGEIKAGQAASGIDVNTGSAVNVRASQREINKLDAETVLSNAQLEAYGYRTQANNFRAEAQLDKMRGRQAVIAGNEAQEGAQIGAAGTLLSGASSLGFKWAEL